MLQAIETIIFIFILIKEVGRLFQKGEIREKEEDYGIPKFLP